jgi:hypothetical protein
MSNNIAEGFELGTTAKRGTIVSGNGLREQLGDGFYFR